MGPFILTMEATQKVTISLVLTMVSLCLKAIHPNTPLLIIKDSQDGKLRKQVIEVSHNRSLGIVRSPSSSSTRLELEIPPQSDVSTSALHSVWGSALHSVTAPHSVWGSTAACSACTARSLHSIQSGVQKKLYSDSGENTRAHYDMFLIY